MYCRTWTTSSISSGSGTSPTGCPPRGEVEWSKYNFEAADIPMLFSLFTMYEKECLGLIERKLVLPAYDYCLKCSHAFNMLDARGAISVTERTSYIGRVRNLRASARRVPPVARGDGFPAAREVLRLSRGTRKKPPAKRDPMERDYLLEIGCEEIPAGFVAPRSGSEASSSRDAEEGPSLLP